MKPILFILTLFTICPSFSQELNRNYKIVNLDSIFGANPGTFVLYYLNSEKYDVYNPEGAKTKYSVHSTSKILWSIIALEEGIVKDENDFIKWDSLKYPKRGANHPGWYEDNNIVSALKYSVNWYYMEILSKMTPEMIEYYLNKYNYQRGFEVGRVHYFGLTARIEKSEFEQIGFLKQFYSNELGVKPKTHELVTEGLFYKQSGNKKVYLRTGMGPVKDNSTGIVWCIGYVVTNDDVIFYAANVLNDDESVAYSQCKDITFRSLKAFGVVDVH